MASRKYHTQGTNTGRPKKVITEWREIKLRGNYFRAIYLAILFVILCLSQTPAIGDYCAASGGGDEYIYSVQTADINKVSGTYTPGGYADYTATDSSEMEIGTSYDLDIISAVGGSVPNGYEGDQCGVWVDWNQDGDFSDANELVYYGLGDGYGTYSSSITPPEVAIAGTTRMRVRLTYTGTVSPCGATEYGEVEDYTVIVTGGTTITLSPSDDTYAHSGNPDTNYSSANGLFAGRDVNGTYRTFLKFDLAAIPPGQLVISAQIHLEPGYVSSPNPVLGVYQATTDNWEESAVTWNNQPEAESTPTDQKTVSGDVTFNVTQDVDDQYVKDGVYSVMIKSTDESLLRYASFWSKDFGTPDWEPKLIVKYAPIFAGGTGDPNNPYQIRTAEQFNSIGLYPLRWGKWYKLIEDISLAGYSGSSYNRIGDGDSELFEGNGPFQGVFDGNFHSISDFATYAFSSTSSNYIGLFGYVYGGTIKNLKIISPNVYTNGYAQSYVGPLAGVVENSNIFGCRVDGGSVDGDEYVGGLIGAVMSGSSIADCDTSASVSGSNNIGGFTNWGSIDGGFSKIKDCYAQGAVTGDDYVGGFVGDSSNIEIMNCYSTGQVTGTTHTGGFSGYNVNEEPVEDNVIGCFWDTTSSNQSTSAAGDGRETADMQDCNTYLSAGWDFAGETANGPSEDWAMPDGGGYPILWYELTTPPDLPTFSGGIGSVGEPYQIATAAQLNQIGHNFRLMDKHFRLTGDVDLGGLKYYMIANRPYSFSGTFDGADHTISNMSIETDFEYELSYAGFIGCLKGYEASLSNLILSEPNVFSIMGMGVGSLVGMNEYGTINNCHAVDAHVIGMTVVGGLAGGNYWNASISECSASGYVSRPVMDDFSGGFIGGLAGENYRSEIINSYAKCDVQADYIVGGLVGNNVYAKLTHCYSQGSVTGSDAYIGGLVGWNRFDNQMNHCYASSVVNDLPGSSLVGGLIGESGETGSKIYTACFWNSEINSSLDGIGNTTDPNVIGESTANMQSSNTYIAFGWDFVGESGNGTLDIWDICEGMNYPRLSWQTLAPGDFLCPDGVDTQDLVVLCEQWLTEVQSMDVAPNGGDGVVTLEDWPSLADGWQITTDLTDLAEFAHQWLEPSAGIADIAPLPDGDGVVNLLDVALFAENWLAGTE